jgi:mannitol 2-dehydrogenase
MTRTLDHSLSLNPPSGLSSESPSALRNEVLNTLMPSVRVPRYNRSALTPAVVHIGVGAFHRAHQAVYFDDLADLGISSEWGVVGVGLHSPHIGRVLAAQDNLYSVLVRTAERDHARVIGIHTSYLFAPDDPARVLDVLAAPSTRLVTLTITGSSYARRDRDDPEVLADVETPWAPASAFGYIVEALDRRRRAGHQPFTVLSCDNVARNGSVTRDAVRSTAVLRGDPGLVQWIDQQVAFPSSMVDRITPETTPEIRECLAAHHGIADDWPVVTEPHTQWVVEDWFCNERPPLDAVGVQFVDDVASYERMKTRLLNGAHCALGYLGYLSGYRTTDTAMADPVLREFIKGYLREAAALLPELPGVDLDAYCADLIERFSNPRIGDQLARLCRRGSTKVPAYVLPSLRRALEQGGPPRPYLVLAVAAWFRYLRGIDCDGRAIEIHDALAETLTGRAIDGGTDPRALLSLQEIFGDLGSQPGVVTALRQALRALETGPRAAAAAANAAAGNARQQSNAA